MINKEERIVISQSQARNSTVVTLNPPRKSLYKRVENPNFVELIMPATIEELQGIVAGLVNGMKDLTTNVTQVTQTVGNMAESIPAPDQHENTQGLRMPSMQLPSFRRDSVVLDDISKFLERFNQQTSHLPADTRFSLLEQQCVGDWPRSVLSIAKIATEGYADKAVEDQLNICIERLRAEFGESKVDQCRRLAAELNAIQQERGESVE
ncbi:hypothetical protein ACROYT_G010486 [Oculina patagonica]